MNDIAVALVQIDAAVGALDQNAGKIIRFSEQAAEQGASVIVFPELVLSGYPPEDLVLKKHFVADCERQLNDLACRLPPDRVVILGSPLAVDGKVHNSAAVFFEGRIAGYYHKMLLPNYGVFDEKRVFAPGIKPLVIEAGPARIGVHICEDSWFPEEQSSAQLQDVRLDALVNLSASPFYSGKIGLREQVLRRTAVSLDTYVFYCNLIGGQDELVFDGASMVLSPEGLLVARARQFEEDILHLLMPIRSDRTSPASGKLNDRVGRVVINLKMDVSSGKSVKSLPEPRIEMLGSDLEQTYDALKTGLRDYVGKNGFSRTVVALSGGIDSALVATLAVDALGAGRVTGVTMPSQYSSAGTRGDAELLATNLGIEFRTLSIQGLYQAYLDELSNVWKGMKPDATEENIQARIRGTLIMALSNKYGWLVLTTGNKSELATGYCTLYGDMAGGFAVIKDVPKTLVFELARWRNRHGPGPVIPQSTIDRPPSAELRPNQKDSDSLPPYDILDAILERYVEKDMGFDEIVAEGFDSQVVKRVVRMVDLNEYKRRQGPPGVKITPKAFGRDRRMPITNLYRGNR